MEKATLLFTTYFFKAIILACDTLSFISGSVRKYEKQHGEIVFTKEWMTLAGFKYFPIWAQIFNIFRNFHVYSKTEVENDKSLGQNYVVQSIAGGVYLLLIRRIKYSTMLGIYSTLLAMILAHLFKEDSLIPIISLVFCINILVSVFIIEPVAKQVNYNELKNYLLNENDHQQLYSDSSSPSETPKNKFSLKRSNTNVNKIGFQKLDLPEHTHQLRVDGFNLQKGKRRLAFTGNQAKLQNVNSKTGLLQKSWKNSQNFKKTRNGN